MSLKVSILAPYISRRGGGLMDSVRSLSRFLKNEHDADVDIISVEDEFSTEDRAQWGDLSVHLVAPRYASFRYAPELSRVLAFLTPDLVHTHGLWTYLSVATIRWSKSNGGITPRPYVVSTHGMLDPWALHNSRWKKITAALVFERRHLENAACIHAFNRAEAAAIRAFGLGNPICIIPNGIDLPGSTQSSGFRVQDSELTTAARGRKVLLYLGRLHAKKNLVALLKAWNENQRSEVRGQKSEEWVLAIAGWDQGGYEAELRQLTADLGLLNSVIFLGPKFGADKDACYQACDAFVLPSLSEGQPLVVLEAWSHARPVLMTPECNLPDGFQKHAAIRMNTTVEGVAEGLEMLFALDEAALQEMGRRARDLVIANFSWSQSAAQMFAVYNWLLGRSAAPDCVLFD